MKKIYPLILALLMVVFGCKSQVVKFRSIGSPNISTTTSTGSGAHFHRYRTVWHGGGRGHRSIPKFYGGSGKSNTNGVGGAKGGIGVAGKLTSGEISDFSKFHLWEKYVANEFLNIKGKVKINPIKRYTVQVKNTEGIGIPFAKVELKTNNSTTWTSVTDNTGTAELWITDTLIKSDVSIEIAYEGHLETIQEPVSFFDGINQVVLPIECKSQIPPVEICFVVDATGSMVDEIAYLKSDLNAITRDISSSIKNEVSFSSVFYKALENSDMVTTLPFTKDQNVLQSFVKTQVSDGGGIEAVAEGLEAAVKNVGWNSSTSFKLMFILLDEPPGFSSKDAISLNASLKLAAEMGIRIVPIICSGNDKGMEYLMRCTALLTNGTYLFLTDHSGVGNKHMDPTTDSYTVYTLQELMINVIKRFTTIPDCDGSSISVVDKKQMDYLFRRDPGDLSQEANMIDSLAKNSLDSSKAQEEIPRSIFGAKAYPNPCISSCTVEFMSPVDGRLYLMDTNGKLLQSVQLNSINSYLMDMSSWSNGCYYIVVETKSQKWINKMIKQ